MDLLTLINAITPATEHIALAIARPYGLTMTFIAFLWFRIDSGVLRMSVAMAFAIPVFAYASPDFQANIEASGVPFIILFLKEIIIGALLGWLISLPLSIAIGAGAIIDFYRGSFQGPPDPTGGQVTAIGNLFMISSLGLFASIGGFWILIDLLYESYISWPIYSPMPNITEGMGVILSMFTSLIKSSFILAAPIVTVMFITDMTYLIAAKLGKKINITFLAFSTKAMVSAILLPIFIFVFIRVQKEDFKQIEMVSSFFKALLS